MVMEGGNWKLRWIVPGRGERTEEVEHGEHGEPRERSRIGFFWFSGGSCYKLKVLIAAFAMTLSQRERSRQPASEQGSV